MLDLLWLLHARGPAGMPMEEEGGEGPREKKNPLGDSRRRLSPPHTSTVCEHRTGGRNRISRWRENGREAALTSEENDGRRKVCLKKMNTVHTRFFIVFSKKKIEGTFLWDTQLFVVQN